MVHTLKTLQTESSVTDMCKISVIVPVYNAEKYIDATIDSIISQSFKNFELLLIDDGSKDLSGEICQKYAKRYDFIRYIKRENSGAAASRNFGMSIADGDYFCFVDSDDYIDREMLEFMYVEAQKTDADILMCGYFMQNKKSVSEIKAQSGIYKGKEINSRMEEIKAKNLIDSPCNKLYRADFVKNSGVLMPENETFEDTDFNLRLLSYNPTFVISDKCFYHYVLRMGSVTRHYNHKKLEIIKKRALLLSEITEGIDAYCDFYYIKSVYSAIIDMFLSCKKDEIKAQIKKECEDAVFKQKAENCEAKGKGASLIKRVAMSHSVNKNYYFCLFCYILKYKLQSLFLKVR